MKVLFIGGTGNISSSVSRLCVERGIDLYLLNRGLTPVEIPGCKRIAGDITQTETQLKLNEHKWDAVVNWIVFHPDEVKRDINLFRGKTGQYFFISSASVYQKPPVHPVITEETPAVNPFWQYSQNKINCENELLHAFNEENFPAVIIRPSHTYSNIIPAIIGGGKEYTLIDRIKNGRKIFIHGDGTSLWVLTHSDDFAKGLTGLIGNKKAIGEIFHITSDEVLTWNKIYEIIAETAGASADVIHIPTEFIEKVEASLSGTLTGDKMHSVIFDNSKIKKFVPEFSAEISFKEGIKRTLNWFESESARMIINETSNKIIDNIINSYQHNF